MEMFNADDDLCATYEVMLMGIDTTSGRPSAFPNDILNNIEHYYNIENVEMTSQYTGHHGIKKSQKQRVINLNLDEYDLRTLCALFLSLLCITSNESFITN